jgi:hypothetical protein
LNLQTYKKRLEGKSKKHSEIGIMNNKNQ